MSEFVNYLSEVFEHFGDIQARRMFGGYGVYHNDLMFGLVADDALYLKADAESSGKFAERGLLPFEYVKDGKKMNLWYFQAPGELFDDPDEAKVWADRAFQAALRSKSPKSKSRKHK